MAVDLSCGQGHLLWALVAELARTQPDARLNLLGMEDDVHQWRIGKLLFSLSGLLDATLLHYNALRATCYPEHQTIHALPLGRADMVVLALPAQASFWSHELAHQAGTAYFPARPPGNRCLALIWLSLTALQPDTGRLAVLTPLKLLSGHEGYALSKHLVDMNLLDAVISIPGIVGSVLLVVRQRKRQHDVAFINAINFAHTLQAWQARQAGQAHPGMRCLTGAYLANQRYQLDIKLLGAAVSDVHLTQ
jgi:type I restriction-modification system DNA methylase subunit